MGIFYKKSDIPDHLQKYFVPAEIGLEQTPEEYITAMVEVFRCVRDVLADDGTLWVNVGDSYAANRSYQVPSTKGGPKHSDSQSAGGKGSKVPDGLKPKDIIGIPWMLAFALRADGWYLRQDIIWHKPNPMPESVRDRCTKAHEYVFLLSKSDRYFYDHEAIMEPAAGGDSKGNGQRLAEQAIARTGGVISGGTAKSTLGTSADRFRNRRSVWTVATRPYNGKKALTDYVGDDGKPYTASPDCPIHGHLARRQTSGTHGYGGQQGLTQTGSVGTDTRRAALPVCGEQSTTSHSSQASVECNSQRHTTGSSHENKTDFRLNVHTSVDGNQFCSGCKSASGEHQDCKKDCSRQSSSLTANSHNTGTSKTGRASATTQPCMPCDETGIHTQSTRDQHGLFEQDRGISASSILTGETSVHPSQDTRSCNAGTSSELVSMAYKDGKKCTCNEVIIDHFATFPPALIEPCILAGSRPGDIVLDPFMGSGTTAQVAIQHGRRYLGCELNEIYADLQQQRIDSVIPKKSQQQELEIA